VALLSRLLLRLVLKQVQVGQAWGPPACGKGSGTYCTWGICGKDGQPNGAGCAEKDPVAVLPAWRAMAACIAVESRNISCHIVFRSGGRSRPSSSSIAQSEAQDGTGK